MSVLKCYVGAAFVLVLVSCNEIREGARSNPFFITAVPPVLYPTPASSQTAHQQNVPQLIASASLGNPSHHYQIHNNKQQPDGSRPINILHHYPHNPFLHQQLPVDKIPESPVLPPHLPVFPTEPPGTQPQIEPIKSLRKKCLGPRGQYPSNKCNTFVNCWDDVVVEQFCPVGLVFNPAGFCDYGYNVDCKGKPIAEFPVAENSTSVAPPVTATLPAPVDPTTKPPPQNQVTSAPPNVPITDENLKKKCLGPHGLYPSNYCNKFVNCWDQFAIEQDCAPGLFFSEKGYCDFAYNVNCGNRIVIAIPLPYPPTNVETPKPSQPDVVTAGTPPPITLPTVKPITTESPIVVTPGIISDDKLKTKCLKPRGQFPTYICNNFVNCWDGFAIEQQCGVGLLFSEKGFCDYDFNVDCKNRVIIANPSSEQPDNQKPPHQLLFTENTTKKPDSPIETIAPSYGDDRIRKKCLGLRGQFPSDSCHKYIDCWKDSAIEFECPSGLLFSEKGYCDYPSNVNCNNRTVINREINQESLCPNPQGTFRDKFNCSRYFTCINNVVVAKLECPSGLSFNNVIGVCDFSYRVDCSNDNQHQTFYQPFNILQKVPAGLLDKTVDCQPGKVFRLNPECTSAARCRNSATEVIHCPGGLVYDGPSDRCLVAAIARWYLPNIFE